MGDKPDGIVLSMDLERRVRRLVTMCQNSDFLKAVTEGEVLLRQYPNEEALVGVLARAYVGAWTLHGHAEDARKAAQHLRSLAELTPTVEMKRKALKQARALEARVSPNKVRG